MSSKLIRKALSFVLALITVLCLVPSFHKAEAATSWPEVSESKTILFYSRRVIKFYKEKVCNEDKRYDSIPKNSECHILSITKNGSNLVLRVRYNGIKGFVYADKVFDNLEVLENKKSKAEVCVYKYKTTTTAWSRSYVEIGDDVWKIHEHADNGRVQIIYKAKSGTRWYKLAYVTKSDYNLIKTSYQENTSIANKANEEIDVANSGKKYKMWYYGKTDAQYNNNASYYNDIAWCAIFVSWCANKCSTGTSKSIIKSFAGCGSGVQTFKDNHRWVTVGQVKPRKGWIVFFDNTYADNNLDGNADHVGIVYSIEGSTLWVIEGNCGGNGGKVKKNSYNIGASGLGNARAKTNPTNQIIGYGAPKF